MAEVLDDYDLTTAPWPGDRDRSEWTAEAVLRYFAASGLAQASVSVDLSGFFSPGGELNELRLWRWQANLMGFVGSYHAHLALSALRDLDPAKADEVAAQMIASAEEADHGEWLAEWAHAAGLDVPRLADAARARLAANGETERDG